MYRRLLITFIFALGGACWSSVTSYAADEFSELRVIRTLPRTESEMERAHRDNAGNACELIGEGQSMELSQFSTIRTDRDRRENRSARPAIRQSVMSIGLTMDSSDKAELPTVSRGKILDYLEENYVSIQLRVRRDLVDSKLYFFHRPMAATMQYRGAKTTQQFQPTVTNATREFRSIGLFTKAAEHKPEDLRTLVILFKNQVLKSSSRTQDQYEFAFIRGREGAREDRLNIHVFVTSEDRSQLTYLNPYRRPTNTNDCSIRGSIVITDFDRTGLIPTQSATRSYRLDAKRIFPMANIDEYCKSHSLEGGIYDNLDTVLDVLIDQMHPPKK